MAKITIAITGDKELNRKLARLRGNDAKKAVRQASRQALRPLLAEIRGNAPRKENTLARSFRIRAVPRSRRSVGSRITTRPELFQGDFYGAFIELGTKFIEATHFVRESARDKRQQVLSIYRRLIRDAILRKAKRP